MILFIFFRIVFLHLWLLSLHCSNVEITISYWSFLLFVLFESGLIWSKTSLFHLLSLYLWFSLNLWYSKRRYKDLDIILRLSWSWSPKTDCIFFIFSQLVLIILYVVISRPRCDRCLCFKESWDSRSKKILFFMSPSSLKDSWSIVYRFLWIEHKIEVNLFLWGLMIFFSVNFLEFS